MGPILDKSVLNAIDCLILPLIFRDNLVIYARILMEIKLIGP